MRARLLDPETSHMAGQAAAAFAGSHSQRIQMALAEEPMSAQEISRVTGLTVVQIDRRLPEMERGGFVEVVKVDGMTLSRDGYRVWRLTA